MMKSIAILLLVAASVSAQRNTQGFTNRGGDSVTLRSVRVDDDEIDTQFYDFRTRPVPRVRFRHFDGDVSDGDDGIPTAFRLEFASVIEFLEQNGEPGFQSDGNDTIIQEFDLRRGLNEDTIWQPIETSSEEVDGVTVYTVVGELENEQFKLEMFGAQEEYAVDTSRFGLTNQTRSITFSPDEIHIALTLYTGLFDQPLRNDTMLALVANVVRRDLGEASFMPGGDRSSGPESSDEDDETIETDDDEDDLTPDGEDLTTDGEGEGETSPPGEGETSPPGEGEGEGEGEEGEGEGQQTDEEVPAPSTDEETTPTDEEPTSDETSSDEQREGGGREDRDIEFDVADDEPLYFMTWDDEVTAILNDGTEVEVDVITSMEADPEDRVPDNRQDPDREQGELVVRAYYTFDITNLDTVDRFVWDPEVGADYSRLAGVSPASTLSLAGAWLYVSALVVGAWAAL